MGLLDDLFNGATPQAAPNLDDPLVLQELVRRALQANVPQQLMGTSTAEQIAQQPQQQMNTVNIQPRPQASVPYQPPRQEAAPQMAPAPAPRAAPPQQQQGDVGMERLGAILQGLGDRNQGVLGRIGGGMQASSQFDRSRETENLTVRALVDRGLDQQTATAVARNPQLAAQHLAPSDRGVTFGEIGSDQMGNKVYGWRDARNQTVRPANGQNGQNAPTQNGGPDPSLTGDAFMEALDPSMRGTVKAIVEGRAPYPSAMAQRTPQGRMLMMAINQYDPTFDATTYQTRQRTRNEFNAGQASRNIVALNTAMGHLENLDRGIDGLNNADLPFGQAVRSVTNPIARQIPEVAGRMGAFDTSKKAVMDEVAKVFAGQSSAMFDRKEWESKLDATRSPTELKAVVRELNSLLKSRVEALANQYNTGMNTSRDTYEFLSPAAAASMRRRLGEEAPEGDGGGEPPAPRQQGTTQRAPAGGDQSAALNNARAAIQRGASRDAVIRRLRENGIDPAGL